MKEASAATTYAFTPTELDTYDLGVMRAAGNYSVCWSANGTNNGTWVQAARLTVEPLRDYYQARPAQTPSRLAL